jgi:hypothetical protein
MGVADSYKKLTHLCHSKYGENCCLRNVNRPPLSRRWMWQVPLQRQTSFTVKMETVGSCITLENMSCSVDGNVRFVRNVRIYLTRRQNTEENNLNLKCEESISSAARPNFSPVIHHYTGVNISFTITPSRMYHMAMLVKIANVHTTEALCYINEL